MSSSDKEQEYLRICNECEILNLEISRSHKALNDKKRQLETLETKRKKLRVELVGLLEPVTSAPITYPAGYRGKPKEFA